MKFWNKSEIICAASLMSLIVTVGVSEANFVMAAANPVICAGDGVVFYPLEKRLIVDGREFAFEGHGMVHGTFPDAMTLQLEDHSAAFVLRPSGAAPSGTGPYVLDVLESRPGANQERTMVCSGYGH